MIKLLLLLFGGLKYSKVLLTGGTMLISLAAYSMLWGWRFALGFIVLLFLHEMGHYLAARQRGLAVGAPTFIPFVGAWIELKQQPMSVETEAYVAFAGPFIGSMAAFALYYYARQNGNDGLLLAVAYTGFMLNLINLLPISPLDGGRITAVLTPRIWLLGVPMLVALFLYQPSPMLVVIGVLAAPQVVRAWRYDATDPRNAAYYGVDMNTRVEYGVLYLGLVALLGLMTYAMHQELAVYRTGSE
jgi:Zn-dependent protease